MQPTHSLCFLNIIYYYYNYIPPSMMNIQTATSAHVPIACDPNTRPSNEAKS